MTAGTRNRKVMQNSWIVADIDAAVDSWVRTTGIGPFFLVPRLEIPGLLYRGQPTDAIASIALAQAGEVQIELIQQHNDAPSVYRDMAPAGGTGFHHIAYYCHDYDADLAGFAAAGQPVAQSGAFAGKRFCYLDTRASLGCLVELIEHSPVQQDFFARIAAAAVAWDGHDPLRPAFS